MKNIKIEECAELLSKEIIETKMLDIPSLKTKIQLRMESGLNDFLHEYLHSFEIEEVAIKRQMELVFGTKDYMKLGFKLGAIKTRRKATNRVMSDSLNQDKFGLLKTYVKNKFGEEEMKSFYNLFNDELESVENKYRIDWTKY